MPARDSQKGIISVIIVVVVLLLLVGGAVFTYSQKDKLPLLGNKSSNTVSIPPTDPKETDGWQSYLIKFGQIRIKYPQDWLIRVNANNNSSLQYIDFLYNKEKGIISDQYTISLTIGKAGDLYFDTQNLQKTLPFPV